MVKSWKSLAVLGAALAGLSACSGGNGPALDGWAQSVCSGIKAPVQAANAAQADTGTVKKGESPSALATRLAADFTALATANSQIAQAVQKAGAPKTDNGASLQADAVSELDQAAGGYTKAAADVKSLTSNDQARFASGLKGISDQVAQLAALSNTALKKLQTGELGVALAKQPGCSGSSAGAPGTGTTGAGSGATADPSAAASKSAAPAKASASSKSSTGSKSPAPAKSGAAPTPS